VFPENTRPVVAIAANCNSTAVDLAIDPAADYVEQPAPKPHRIRKKRKARARYVWDKEMDIALMEAWNLSKMYGLNTEHGDIKKRETAFLTSVAQEQELFGRKVTVKAGKGRIDVIMKVVKTQQRIDQRRTGSGDDATDDEPGSGADGSDSDHVIGATAVAIDSIRTCIESDENYERLAYDIYACKQVFRELVFLFVHPIIASTCVVQAWQDEKDEKQKKKGKKTQACCSSFRVRRDMPKCRGRKNACHNAYG
jgi:hypothetical protein